MPSLDWTTVRPATPITTIGSYLSIPAFAGATTWLGASEIVGQYNYAAENNFSLLRLPTAPDSPTFVPCIRYREGDEVTRYKLWSVEGDSVPAELYAGQVIKANFCIEIWTVEGEASPLNSSAIQITTSVRTVPVFPFTELDDTSLASASQVSTMFNTALSGSLPTSGLVAQYDSTGIQGSVVTEWSNSLSNNYHMTPTGSVTSDSEAGAFEDGFVRFTSAGGYLTSGGNMGTGTRLILMVARQTGWVDGDNFLQAYAAAGGKDAFVTQFGTSPNIVAYHGTQESAPFADMPLNQWCIVALATTLGKSHLRVDDRATITAEELGGIAGQSSIALGPCGLDVAEVLVYVNSLGDDIFTGQTYPAAIAYLASKYQLAMPLPLPFQSAVSDNS